MAFGALVINNLVSGPSGFHGSQHGEPVANPSKATWQNCLNRAQSQAIQHHTLADRDRHGSCVGIANPCSSKWGYCRVSVGLSSWVHDPVELGIPRPEDPAPLLLMIEILHHLLHQSCRIYGSLVLGHAGSLSSTVGP